MRPYLRNNCDAPTQSVQSNRCDVHAIDEYTARRYLARRQVLLLLEQLYQPEHCNQHSVRNIKATVVSAQQPLENESQDRKQESE